MASASGAGSFAAGFGKSLTDVLLGHRREQQAKEDRDFSATLPIMLQLAQEDGDYSRVENLITQHNPALAAKLKKNSPFAQLGPLLQGQYRAGTENKLLSPPALQPAEVGAPQAATAATAGSFGLQKPAEEPAPPGSPTAPQPLTAGPQMVQPSVQAPSPVAQSGQSTFFGSPVMTPTQRAEQQAQMVTLADRAQFMERYARAKQAFPNDPDKQADYALYGTRPPERASAEPYQAVDGVDADGKPVSAVFNQAKGLYEDAITKQPIPGFHHATTSTSRADSEFDKYLAAYAKDKNKPPDALSAPERLDARQKFEEAGRAKPATATNTDPQALARLAIRNPAVLQGLTPTVSSAVVSAIAADPQLSAQYEVSRMAPVRQQAQSAIAAMNDLLVTDKDGKVTGLTPGAQALYGYSGMLGKGVAGSLGGIDASTAKSALDQLTGTLVVDLLRDLKAQSRTGATGFGQLSARELDVLQSSATMLQGKISEPRALQELIKLRDRFQKILAPSAQESTPLSSTGNATGAAPTTITLDTPIFIGADGKPSLGGGR